MSPNKISIALFDEFPIRIGGRSQRLALAGPTLSLLRYLLIFPGHAARREYLADLLWTGVEPERRRAALNSAVWRINRVLAAHRGVTLLAERETLRLRLDSDVAVDARELDAAVRNAGDADRIDATNAKRLAEALELCSGPFLGGAVEDWALAEREHLFNVRLRGLTAMMHWCAQTRRYEDALEYGRRLLEADPFRESAQCEVMWLYVLNRQRAQALRQYEAYRRLLKSELSIEPMPETRALFSHIRSGLDLMTRPEPGSRVQHGGDGGPESPLNALFGAIDRSRRDIYTALCAQALAAD